MYIEEECLSIQLCRMRSRYPPQHTTYRIVASAVVARLHANDAFNKQLEKAKKEFAALVKAGKVKKSTFKAN